MPERAMQGDPASPGAAVGPAWPQAQEVEIVQLVPVHEREREREAAHVALAGAASALGRLASGLPPDEAAIIEASVLMAGDPALLSAVDSRDRRWSREHMATDDQDEPSKPTPSSNRRPLL